MNYFNLPDEILLLISEFSYNEKKQFKKVLKQIKLNSGIKILNKNYNNSIEIYNHRCCTLGRRKVYHSFYNNNHSIFKLILQKNFNKIELKELFAKIKSCNCCSRHKRNCPKTIEDFWDEDPIFMDYVECPKKCKCRYYKRKLCEAYETYNSNIN